MKKKIICFDLDNVICLTKKNNYKKSKPIPENIKVINQLYEKGNYIKIFTARFMGRSNQNTSLAIKKGYKLTTNQLKEWKVKYHKLILGKPSFDLYIDDLNHNFDKDWRLDIKKIFKLK